MKLLFCGFVDDFGGAQRMQILLANTMAERGHDVTILALTGDDIKYPISDSVKLIINEKCLKKFKGAISRFKVIRKTIKDLKPDLSIHFWMQSANLCALMGRNVAKRTIYAERGDPYDSEFDGFLGIVRKLTFPLIGAFVFQTKGASDFFDEKIRNRSKIIINPFWLDTSKYPHTTSPQKRIVSVGRLHHQKNHLVLIDAISKMSYVYDDYIVEIYGNGELEQVLQERINSLHLNHRIFLKGATTDILNKIKDAAVFVLTSDYEGIPNALIEAMALGLPCVSTDCRPGGARELIEDGVNGLIVPCRDSNAIATAIERMLANHKGEAYRMANEATKIVNRTQPSIVFDEWEIFFNECIEKNNYIR